MSVDVQAYTDRASWLTIRLAASMIAAGGQMSDAAVFALAAEAVAEQNAKGRPRPLQRLNEAVKPLRDDGVIVLVDDVWYAPNVADLSAWVTDALEEREEAGLLRNPVIPQARSAA